MMIDHHERCTRLPVLTVEMKPKFPSNQMAPDQFTVKIATKNESHEDIN